MKIQKKYRVDLSDCAYHFAQYDVGTLREVLDGKAAIWHNRDDWEYYTLDSKVVKFYDDLEDALQNLEELKDALIGVYRHLYREDAARMVTDWIYDHFYWALGDPNETISLFAHWKDARAAFIAMIEQDAPDDVEPLEDFRRAV